jgi:hydroxymethylglutaryl-CoA synthase
MPAAILTYPPTVHPITPPAAGPARPTGGVGAVACLIGPDAPLRLVPKTRSTHSVNVYDFYKPAMSSEYPSVDGALSQVCYIKAVDDCYNGALDKLQRQQATSRGTRLNVESAWDHMVFHSPYNKLVQQSFRRMLFNDARRAKAAGVPLPAHLAPLEPFVGLPYEATLSNRDLDKALQAVKTDAYARMVGPSENFSKVRRDGGRRGGGSGHVGSRASHPPAYR